MSKRALASQKAKMGK